MNKEIERINGVLRKFDLRIARVEFMVQALQILDGANSAQFNEIRSELAELGKYIILLQREKK